MSASSLRFATMLAAFAIAGAMPAAVAQEGARFVEPGRSTLPRYEARFGRAKPVIAVVAYNPGTELTDFVVPYGVLAES